MPELPEVETVKRTVEPKITGQIITDIDVRNDAVLENVSFDFFIQFIQGNYVVSMSRRGKYLIFHMNQGGDIVLHLRMTGQLITFENEPALDKHCHLVIYFEQGGFYYRDVRRFGRFWIVKDGKYSGTGMEHLGPEPFDKAFCGSYLLETFSRHHCPVKSELLDQHIVAGIGNIYADEILFDAGINPFRSCHTLTLKECESICSSASAVLKRAIEKRGTTFRDYRDGDGEKGTFQELLKIFHKQGEPCPRCGTLIKKSVCNGRGTFYCPKCQPKDSSKRVIGLTGGIASGKSFISGYLQSLGAEIIDADEIAREIMVPHGKVLEKLNKTFGGGFLNDDGSLNRKKLRDYVFADKDRVKTMNQITHPVIRRIALSRIQKSTKDLVVLDAPLLIEAKFHFFCDEIWVVYVDEKKQRSRLKKRDNINEKLADEIIASQCSFEYKKKYADIIIDNSGTRANTKKQIRLALAQVKIKNDN